MLSFDEWNVWYRTRRTPEVRTRPGWPVAPPLLEEVYDVADALVVGGACIALLNHADRVKVACLAQLVNVIAPIMTEPGGPAWRQTIFFPFAQTSRFGRGRVLRAQIDAPSYAASYDDPRGAEEHRFALPDVPYLKLAAVHDPEAAKLTLLALNRSLDQPLPLEVTDHGLRPPRARAGPGAPRRRPHGREHQGRSGADPARAARRCRHPGCQSEGDARTRLVERHPPRRDRLTRPFAQR